MIIQPTNIAINIPIIVMSAGRITAKNKSVIDQNVGYIVMIQRYRLDTASLGRGSCLVGLRIFLEGCCGGTVNGVVKGSGLGAVGTGWPGRFCFKRGVGGWTGWEESM